MSSTGWSNSSIISIQEELEDDALIVESGKASRKIEQLEKVVALQRNEIMLLQASMADVIRRIQNVEISQADQRYHHQTSTLPRNTRLSSTRSSYSMSPSQLPRPNQMSKSVHGSLEKDPMARRLSTSSRNSDMVNVSIGKSPRGSPLRKWVSSQDVKNQKRRGSEDRDAPSTSISPAFSMVTVVPRTISRRRTSSSSTSFPLKSCSRKNPVEPTISNGSLQISSNGKTIQIPIPSRYEKLELNSEQNPPEVKPKLKHVYSVRCKDVRACIELLPTGEILFFSSNILVLQNIEQNTQRFYTEHTCDVKSIAIHPNKILIASGQASCHSADRHLKKSHNTPVDSPDELEKQLEADHTEAHIRIWDSIKLTTLFVLGGLDENFDKGVGQLSFSKFDGGQLLCVVDESLKHTLSVWDWSKQLKLAETKAANDTVFECAWHTAVNNLIVLYGRGHLSFVSFDPTSKVLVKTSAPFDGREKPKAILSMAFTAAGLVVTGDSNGTITLWDTVTCKAVKQAHKVHPGGVYALHITRSGRLISGGKDKIMNEWICEDLVRHRRPFELPEDRGVPRIFLSTGDDFFIGTSTNSILKGNMEHGFGSYIEGDAGEVTSLVPTTSHLITGSADGFLRKWNFLERRMEASRRFINGITAMDIEKSNILMIIGFSSGSWHMYSLLAQETILEQSEGVQSITCVKFAPGGTNFVIATKEKIISIYRWDASKTCQRLWKITNLASPVVNVDWDSEGNVFRVNTQAGSLHFYNRNGDNIEPIETKDLRWATSTCKISFETGLAYHSSNSSLTCSTRSHNDELLVTGLSNGTVRLYKNPVTSSSAGFVELFGHTQEVDNVIFLDPTNFCTSSSLDCSLFSWSF